MEQITFDQVPSAISILLDKVSNIEKKVLAISSKDEQTDDQILTVHQAAEFLSLAVPTVYTMISRGELPVMKRSKRNYFLKAELINYLKVGRRKTLAETAKEADVYLSNRKK